MRFRNYKSFISNVSVGLCTYISLVGMYFKMAFVKYIGFILVVMAVKSDTTFGQFLPSDGSGRGSSYSFPFVRNRTSYFGRQLGSGFNDLSFTNSSFVNSTRIMDVIREILDAPTVKIALRVSELYQTKVEPVDIFLYIVASPDMQELISVWLSRIDIPSEQIKAVQSIVRSQELLYLIETLADRNESSPMNTLCVAYNFTKLPEFRQLLNYTMAMSAYIDVPEIPQLTQLNGTPNGLSQLMDLDGSRITEFMFSPVIQAFLEVFCQLVGSGGIPDLVDVPDLNFPSTKQPNTSSDSNDFPKSEAQVLPSVANLTNASPDELLNQLQAILTSPVLAEAITNLNLNTSLDINDLITQLGAALTTGNTAALQQIIGQFISGFQGNGTLGIQDLVTQLTQQANDALSVVLPLARQFIENAWRSALTDNGVSEACQDSTVVYIEALLGAETWTLQFLDAFGKIPSSILSLRLQWLGSFDECTAIISSGVEQIKGKYCRAAFPITGLPDPGITLGTCVPHSCSASDTLGILLMAQRLLLNGTTPLVPDITCIEDKEFETDAVIVTCVLVIFGFIVFCGTLYDVVSVQMKSNEVPENKQPASGLRESLSSTATSSSTSTSGSNIPASLYKPIKTRLETSPGFVNNAYTSGDEFTKNADDFSDSKKQALPDEETKISDVIVKMPTPKDDAPSTPAGVPDKGALEKVMLSFSAYTNGVKILSTHQASGSLGSIHGIRFLSMAWVILGHTYYFVQGYGDNLVTHYLGKLNDWTFPVVTYATVAVDSFFTISGILVGYLTLRQLKKVGGAKKMNWFMFYFHRFWRLTPPYMLIMMVATVILPYVATGPMWNTEDFPGCGGCRKYWWTNLLYVNNYVNVNPTSDMCMGWTWYLANDMQFYILSPLILLPLFYNVIAGLVSCLMFLAGTIITTAILAHKYEYTAQGSNLAYAPPAVDSYDFQRIYIPSYARMGPYVIGLFTGYLLYRFDCKIRIPKVLNLLGWVICLAICCCDVYGLYSYNDNHILTQTQSDFFLALHRTGWGVAVSWIVFACATGHGGWINEMLSWKPFIPLGRLTYGAYLLHPLVIFLFITSRRNPTFFSDYEVVYLFVGHITLSYAAAFVVGLFFESPMMGLEKVFFNPQKKK